MHRTHRAQNASLPQGWLKNARTTILRRIFILTALTSCHLLSPEGCLAHPISVTYTQAFVSRNEVTISIEGFLEDLYLFHDLKTNNKGLVRPEEIKRGLVIEEQGGAVSRVDQVEMINGQRLALWGPSPGETLPDDSLSYQCEWNVTATVEHWGHPHERTNQYAAVFAIVPVEGHWKIIEFELLNETKLQSETRLRHLATLSE